MEAKPDNCDGKGKSDVGCDAAGELGECVFNHSRDSKSFIVCLIRESNTLQLKDLSRLASSITVTRLARTSTISFVVTGWICG